MPVKDGGPPGVKTWFVPAEATLTDPTGPFNYSWQFDLTGVPAEQIVAFYDRELTARGYTVSRDYVAKVGANELDVALGWKGNGSTKPYGTVTVNSMSGGVMVAITKTPSDLAPK
ncbi:MAG: hypothetical protein LWW86_15660 [Micrococcales bacterium]|nr:hypothetical protein [Micrococcales bacterium]